MLPNLMKDILLSLEVGLNFPSCLVMNPLWLIMTAENVAAEILKGKKPQVIRNANSFLHIKFYINI